MASIYKKKVRGSWIMKSEPNERPIEPFDDGRNSFSVHAIEFWHRADSCGLGAIKGAALAAN